MADYTGIERRQAPYVSSDVAIRIQKWAIGGLVAMIMALGGWIYSYGQFTLKVQQVEAAVQELRDTIYTMDARLTELMITRMDERFRRSDWEREEAKLEKHFDQQRDEINRLHKEVNRLIDKIDSWVNTHEHGGTP